MGGCCDFVLWVRLRVDVSGKSVGSCIVRRTLNTRVGWFADRCKVDGVQIFHSRLEYGYLGYDMIWSA